MADQTINVEAIWPELGVALYDSSNNFERVATLSVGPLYPVPNVGDVFKRTGEFVEHLIEAKFIVQINDKPLIALIGRPLVELDEDGQWVRDLPGGELYHAWIKAIREHGPG